MDPQPFAFKAVVLPTESLHEAAQLVGFKSHKLFKVKVSN